MTYRILVVNPGSTSTKVALYQDEKQLFMENCIHEEGAFAGCQTISSQFDIRLKTVYAVLKNHPCFNEAPLSAVAARGGLLPRIHGGGYRVCENMCELLRGDAISPHASNLGGLLAFELAKPFNAPAFIYDAVTADEFQPLARITGLPDVSRQSMCHVLNSKAMARRLATSKGKKYEDLNLLVAHLGGGISISAHKNGKIIDCIRDDDGPFAPERSGSIPLLYIINMCYSGKYNKKEMLNRVRGMGGLKAYFGTSDCQLIESRLNGLSDYERLIYEAQSYQIAKGIGELAPVLYGKIDYILLTGGLAYSQMITKRVADMVGFIAPVAIIPGENEMEALAKGALRVLKGEEEAYDFQ